MIDFVNHFNYPQTHEGNKETPADVHFKGKPRQGEQNGNKWQLV